MNRTNEQSFDLLVLTAKWLGKAGIFIQDCIDGLYDSIIPPLLGYKRMQRLIEESYSNEGIYTTEEYNLSGFFSWELEAIQEYLNPGKRFMVLSAGGGREVIALLKHGIDVDAWECNSKLRDFGNQLLKKKGFSASIGSVGTDECPSVSVKKKYDFCIIGWSAYCHILNKAERISLLKNLKRMVKEGVLISFVGKKNTHNFKRVIRKMVSFVPGATGDISNDLVVRQMTFRVGFDNDKIAEEAKAAGFTVVKYKNYNSGYPYAVLSSPK